MKLDNVGLEDTLGKARKISITKDEHTIVEGHGAESEIEGLGRPDSQPDRGHHLGTYDKEKLQ